MDFTREPIIETVITPKEGCKLVIRNSKSIGQEEYFVDAIEVVTFGNAIFFRSLERPKAFMVPATDYEVLEVREARIVLKNVGVERSIKIGGGREAAMRASKEVVEEKPPTSENFSPPVEAAGRIDRKRDRRRQARRRRSREELPNSSSETSKDENQDLKLESDEPINIPPPAEGVINSGVSEVVSATGSLMSHLLAPPPLISETIARYKEQFRDAFYTREEQEAKLALDSQNLVSSSLDIPLEQPAFGSFELSEEDEEEIYRQRRRRYFEEHEPEEPIMPQSEVKETSFEGSEQNKEELSRNENSSLENKDF